MVKLVIAFVFYFSCIGYLLLSFSYLLENTDGKVTTCKENIEVLDEEKKSMTFNLFEGDVEQHYKIFKINLQVIDKDDGGAIAKWSIEYEKVNENVEPPYGYLGYLTKLSKDTDDHILKA